MRMIRAEELSAFPLGRLGENEVTTVVFDITEWRELYGEGTFSLLNRRSGDAAAYPCVVEQDEREVRWNIKAADVAVAGYGQCELIYTVGSTVAKSKIYNTYVDQALTGGDNVPEPWEDWVQDVLDAVDRIEAAAEQIKTSATPAQQVEEDTEHRFVSDAEKTAWNGKQDTDTITTTTSSTITLTPHNTTVVTNTPTSLDVTLAAPAVGVDFLCGLNFKAGAAFTLTETAPTGYAIVWEDEPAWTAGNVYEIIYRCLWLADDNNNVMISAKYSEVSA